MAITWLTAMRTAIRRPGVLTRRAALCLHAPHFRRQRVQWLSNLTGSPPGEVGLFVKEIEGDQEFLGHIQDTLRRATEYLPLPTDFMVNEGGNTIFFHCVSLYAFVRLVRPKTIVETGGTPGKSSAFILRALQRNTFGHLYTVDLPPPETEREVRSGEHHSFRPLKAQPNWCVPDSLRQRQTILLGDAKIILSGLLGRLQEIDLFIHDSDHSYAHMLWEFGTAFPFINNKGYLWSDDIGTNSSWIEFCTQHNLTRSDFTGQGVAKVT